MRQCWGGFLRQWKGFWLGQRGFFASVVVFCDGNRSLLHRRTSTAERGLVEGFLRRSVLGVFCDSAGKVFCDSGRVLGYGKGFFASVVVFWEGNRGLLRRTAERSIKKTSSWATVKQ